MLPACQRSISDLGIDYLDLYLVHFPMAMKYTPIEEQYPPDWPTDWTNQGIPFRETWEAMEDLVRKGLVKNIGVCNFTVAQLRDLLTYAKIKPAVLQQEIHPHNTCEKLLRFCRQEGIAVTAYSQFGATSYI